MSHKKKDQEEVDLATLIKTLNAYAKSQFDSILTFAGKMKELDTRTLVCGFFGVLGFIIGVLIPASSVNHIILVSSCFLAGLFFGELVFRICPQFRAHEGSADLHDLQESLRLEAQLSAENTQLMANNAAMMQKLLEMKVSDLTLSVDSGQTPSVQTTSVPQKKVGRK